MKNKIAAVVVTYNRKELLRGCMDCIRAQSEPSDILVIDNASTDGTAELFAAEQDALMYFNTGANLGGAGGFNFGMRKAVELGYEFVWVMDDDCMPTENALEELVKTDRELNGNYGFLSSKVLWKDGSLCAMNRQRDTLTHTIDKLDSCYQPVVMASFVSLFLPTRIVKEMGLPIKEFFIWTDDWEFTRRISKKYPCYAVAESVVIHKSKSNIGANIATESADRLDRFNYLYRNDVYLYRREGLKGFIYEVVRLSGHCARVLMKSSDHKKERLRKILSGTKEGLKFKPVIEFAETNEKKDFE